MKFSLSILTLTLWGLCSLGCSLFQGSNFPFSSSSAINEQLSSKEIEELIFGWKEMIQTIENLNPSSTVLQTQTFKLQLKLHGEWELRIFPEKAFNIRRDQNGFFIVSIANSNLLFDDSTGLLKRTYIQAELSKIGGIRGKIDLNPHTECQYVLSFYQKNGMSINFKKIGKGYQYSFVNSHPQILQFHSQQKNSVTFIRSFGNQEKVSVSLKLVDKKTGETYNSPAVNVPNCQSQLQEENEGTLSMNRTPGQCIVHLKGGAKVFSGNENDPQFTTEESFGNNCSERIRCNLLARYGLVKNGKIVLVRKKSFPIVLLPLAWLKVDTSFSVGPTKQSFDSKVYSISEVDKSAMPADFPVPANKDFLDCHWDKVPKDPNNISRYNGIF